MLSFSFAFQNSPESTGVRTTKNEDEDEKEKELQLESLLGAFESLGKAWPRSAETQRKQRSLRSEGCCCSQGSPRESGASCVTLESGAFCVTLESGAFCVTLTAAVSCGA